MCGDVEYNPGPHTIWQDPTRNKTQQPDSRICECHLKLQPPSRYMRGRGDEAADIVVLRIFSTIAII
ncbi:hypothetical protein DPMN_169524 [Dreissena polymorpha]|uniref:Uncharacterized protein n=1 Tax=Dreissena polymorpha TaxID=45954 RepID=A0A9D4DUJ9_DREPO|nr:hypothetical protein DPMN_169524 [Dreissena polymorpha]